MQAIQRHARKPEFPEPLKGPKPDFPDALKGPRMGAMRGGFLALAVGAVLFGLGASGVLPVATVGLGFLAIVGGSIELLVYLQERDET